MNEIISFLLSPDFTGGLLILKTTFIVLTIIFLILIIIALFRTTWFSSFILTDLYEFLSFQPYEAKRFTPQWLKIVNRLKTNSESEYKLAILEVNELLNKVLETAGCKGENLEDKIKSMSRIFLSNVEEVRNTHKICDNIIYDPDYHLSLEETKKIFAVYERALYELEAI